jgi:hypothetical protein
MACNDRSQCGECGNLRPGYRPYHSADPQSRSKWVVGADSRLIYELSQFALFSSRHYLQLLARRRNARSMQHQRNRDGEGAYAFFHNAPERGLCETYASRQIGRQKITSFVKAPEVSPN